jgi:predicted anti-sigma-YlaC factor YlaD
MECEGARIAISALLDSEQPGVQLAEVQLHLAECESCQRWREDAHEVTRRFRLAPVDVRAPSKALMESARAAGGYWSWPRAVMLTRLALVIVAVGQIAITVPALVFGSDHDAPMHVAHEMGAFDLALAVGFLVAAWRPSRARGMSTIVGVAALVLILTAMIDLAAGRTTPGDEAPHLLAVMGWLLLRHLSSFAPGPVNELDWPMPAWPMQRGVRLARKERAKEGVLEQDRMAGADAESARETEMPARKAG